MQSTEGNSFLSPTSGDVARSRASAVVSTPQGSARRRKPPEPRSGRPDFCGGDSGEENGRAGGSRGASRVAFGRRVVRFVRRDRRASRRLCRTFGLPDFGKSSAIRLLFNRRGKRFAVHPDPFGGRVRRRVIGGSVPVARLENRSRVARPLSASVVGRRRKSRNVKMAEREGFEPPVLLSEYTRSPGVPNQPLWHLSARTDKAVT